MKRAYWALALVFLVLGATTAVWQKTRPPSVKVLSDYHLTDLSGRMTHNLLRGKETLLVNFWATWCVPCLRELPLLAQAAETLPPETGIIAVSYESKEEISEYIEQNRINVDIYASSVSILRYLEQSGNPTKSLPFSVLLDKNERILARHLGDFKSVEQITEFIGK